MLALHVLASGSKANAAVVEAEGAPEALLVDCGLGARALLSRCEASGIDPLRLRAIVVTHDHSDHTKGLGVVVRALGRLARKRGVEQPRLSLLALGPVARASRDVAEALEEGCDLVALEPGRPVRIGALRAVPFRTEHDAAASCGLRIEDERGDALGFLTDTGVVTEEALRALADVRLLALECNHDTRMLRDGDYPRMLKERIASQRGHLSNEQAAEALARLATARLEHVVAMHLSESNNLPSLAERALKRALEAEGARCTVSVAAQAMAVTVR